MWIRGVVGMVAAVVGLGGCWDSTWGETKAAQGRNLQHAAPARLTAREDAPAARVTTMKVRFYRTREYTAQTVDAERQLREIVEAANGPLADAGVRLEIEETRPWDDAPPASSLPAMLDALAAKDPATETSWVIGLVGALPLASESFHELGMARIHGRHVVLRAATRAKESDAIERAFDERPPEERDRLRRDLRRHRATTILLHEVGHGLGAVHARDPRTVMSPTYAKDIGGFDESSLVVMRLVAASRADEKPDLAALYGDVAAYLRAHPDELVEADRESQIAWLERARAAANAPKPPPAARPAPTSSAAAPNTPETPTTHVAEDAPGLPDGDRATYKRARAELVDGRARDAWTTARPLFTKYPRSFEVQELRCQTALRMNLSWNDVSRECAATVELTGAPR